MSHYSLNIVFHPITSHHFCLSLVACIKRIAHVVINADCLSCMIICPNAFSNNWKPYLLAKDIKLYDQAYRVLLWLEKLHLLAFDFSTISFLSGSFFEVITFASTEVQAFPSCVVHCFTYSSNNRFCHSIFFLLRFSFNYFLSISRFIPMNTVDINRNVLTLFIMLFATPASDATFDLLDLPVKGFLEWVAMADGSEAKEIMASMKIKALWRKYMMRMLQCLEKKNLALHGLGTKKNRQNLRAFIITRTFALKNHRIW